MVSLGLANWAPPNSDIFRMFQKRGRILWFKVSEDMEKRMRSTFGSVAESQGTLDTTISSIISEAQETQLPSTCKVESLCFFRCFSFQNWLRSRCLSLVTAWSRWGVGGRSRRDGQRQDPGNKLRYPIARSLAHGRAHQDLHRIIRMINYWNNQI